MIFNFGHRRTERQLSGNMDFSSIFGDMFGGRKSGGFSDIFDMFLKTAAQGRSQKSRAAAPQKGEDVTVRIKSHLTFPLKAGDI